MPASLSFAMSSSTFSTCSEGVYKMACVDTKIETYLATANTLRRLRNFQRFNTGCQVNTKV